MPTLHTHVWYKRARIHFRKSFITLESCVCWNSLKNISRKESACICISLTYFSRFILCTTYEGRQTNMKKELIHLYLYTCVCCIWQTRKNWVIALCFYDWKLRQPNSTQFYWMKILFSLLKNKNMCVCVCVSILSHQQTALNKILLARFSWIKMEKFLIYMHDKIYMNVIFITLSVDLKIKCVLINE